MQAAIIPGATAPGGEITIGGVNPQRYTGDITYINCASDVPWTVRLTSCVPSFMHFVWK